jgi:hypothetical protein
MTKKPEQLKTSEALALIATGEVCAVIITPGTPEDSGLRPFLLSALTRALGRVVLSVLKKVPGASLAVVLPQVPDVDECKLALAKLLIEQPEEKEEGSSPSEQLAPEEGQLALANLLINRAMGEHDDTEEDDS